MNKDELVVRSLLAELLGDTLNYYIDNLSDLSKSNGDEDPYSRARSVIHKLSPEEQEKIFNFLRLVIVDTTSTVLGTIDGSRFLQILMGILNLNMTAMKYKAPYKMN